MTLCPFLCSNEIKARKRCRLLSSWNCSNVFEKSANIFGNVRKSSESCRKSSEVAGAFPRILVTTRCKSHAFDSGIYHTGQLFVSARKAIHSLNVNIA